MTASERPIARTPWTASIPLSEFSASTPSMSPVRTASAIRRGVAGLWSSTPSTRELPPASRIARARPRQRASSPLVADLLVDAQRAAHPGGGQPAAGLEPGAVLGLADVGQDAERR